MTCSKVERLISAHLDGEITASQWREIEQHIQGCQACAAILQAFEQTTDLFKQNLPERTPSPQVWSQVARRIETLEQPSTWVTFVDRVRDIVDRHLLQPSAAVRAGQVGVAVAAVILVLLTQLQKEPDTNLAVVSDPQQVEIGPAPPSDVEEFNPSEDKRRVLQASMEEQVQRYLEKAGVLLLEVQNSETTTNPDEVADIRSTSKDLLEQTILIKQSLRNSELSALRKMIEQLEMVLLDVANLHETPVTDEIESLKATILQNDLLIRIEIYDSKELERYDPKSQSSSGDPQSPRKI